MENIHVIDNFLNEKEYSIVNDIISSTKWSFNHISNGDYEIEVPFWGMYLNDKKYLTEYVKGILEKHFFKKFSVDRVYATGHTYGQDGTFHIDSRGDDKYTFCLYINNLKKEDIELAAGYIVFKLPDLKYKVCYEPINNRGVFFPSSYVHKGNAFSRFIMDMRICIAFKLTEIK